MSDRRMVEGSVGSVGIGMAVGVEGGGMDVGEGRTGVSVGATPIVVVVGGTAVAVGSTLPQPVSRIRAVVTVAITL